MNFDTSLQRALQQGREYSGRGRHDEAIACFREVLALNPLHAEAQLYLGNACLAQGRAAEAADSYLKVIAAQPNLAAAHFNLGIARYQQGRLDEAEASYRRATMLKPDYAEAYNNLAHVCLDRGRPGDAVAACQQAIALKPDLAAAHQNLGLALLRQGRLEEAIAAAQRALALKPDFVSAYHTLCLALYDLGRMDEALERAQRSLTLQPDDTNMQIFHSALLAHTGRSREALQALDTVLRFAPDSAAALSARCSALLYLPETTPDDLLAASRRFAQRCETPLKSTWRPHTNTREPERRLRIGYVSADFRRHSVANFIEPVLARHDRARFEVFCYYNYSERDTLTETLAALADHWFDCPGLPDEQLAGRIRADGIDILIDLGGHTNEHRLLTFARRPAPVQVTWLGYPATTGLDAMDYRLCTLDTDPPGQEEWHSETLYRLPRTLWCYRPLTERAAGLPTPVVQGGLVTFGSMNSYPKISRETLAAWVDILRAVPDSRLIMSAVPEGSTQQDLRHYFAAAGLAPARITLCGRLPYEEFRQLQHGIDIALDPFPYTGTTTTCETLWMGIPVVSLAGQTSVARSGLALLKAVGLEELVAHDVAGYVRIATDLARDPARLDRLRRDIPARFDASPLRDEAAFTRDLEDAYRDMWRQWCARGPAPETAAPAATPNVKDRLEALLEQGLARYMRREFAAAAEDFRAALALDPKHAEAQRKLGNAYFAQGRLDEAVACYQQAVALDPALVAAHYNLGLAYFRQGRADAAADCYLAVLKLKPDFVEAYSSLGVTCSSQGRQEEALQYLRKALSLQPENALIHNNYGLTLHKSHRRDEAIASYRRALTLKPELIEAHLNLGNALAESGMQEEAIESYRRALALKPDSAEAWFNLGGILLAQGRLDEAGDCLRRTIALKPDYAAAHNNMGQLLIRQDRLDEAVASYRQSIALKPGDAEAHINLGSALTNQGEVEEGMRCYEAGLRIDPASAAGHSARLFALHNLSSVTPEQAFAAQRFFAEQCETPLRPYRRPHTNDRDPGRRLRIGYVSPDLRRHPVANFIEPVLAHHDRDRVEVYGYYNNYERDDWTDRIALLVDRWIPCPSLSDEALAEQIRADRIDILVDLAGHTDKNRLLVFARKPAPVQITYLGDVASTGMETMDWRLSHIDTDPEGYERYNSERLFRLPRNLWCYRPAADLPPVATTTPARRNGHVTFGSMNKVAKVSEATLSAWSELLRRVAGSRLVMAGVPAGEAQRHIRERFATHGIGPERLTLHHKLPLREFRALHANIDIALDPWPFNGNTTTCEVLHLGLPVISLAGDRFSARFGYHLLKTIGLAELAGRDVQDYIAIAESLAADLDRLEALRSGMRARLAASPLRDEAGFTRQLEEAYRAMWRDWCAS
ncbi:MAG: tetratricopeptide repeat protein [Gammaproteobacteria bacterium]|nr:tetratricopeptide repeat protein [Gammaproteobacteria bacterium]